MTSQVPSSSRMTAAARREQILDATAAIAAEHGFHAVSIEAVAREAGISRPIVYGHFRDLAGLLEALIDRGTQRALEQLAPVLPQDTTGEPRELLLAALAGYLEAVRSDPDTWRLALVRQEGAPEILHERIASGRAAVIAQLAESVGPGLVPGNETPDPELTARMLVVFADEAARLLLTDPERFGTERILTHARWVLEQLTA